MTWYDEYAPTCKDCLEMYSNRTPPGKAPCETCRVDLTGENVEPGEIYLLVRGQVITAGRDNMPIDINTPAIISTMDLFEVENKPRCFRMVRWLWHEVRKNAS